MADRVTPPNSGAMGGGLDVDSVETNAPPESVSQDGGAGGLLPLRTSVRMAGSRSDGFPVAASFRPASGDPRAGSVGAAADGAGVGGGREACHGPQSAAVSAIGAGRCNPSISSTAATVSELSGAALSRCRAASAKCRRPRNCQAAATAVRHVVIATPRSARCVWAEMRWRWTLKVL